MEFVPNVTAVILVGVILFNLGEAVGVIAAQSIGEPGTQLNNEDLPYWWGRFKSCIS